MSNWVYIGIAYGLTWIVVGGYAAYLRVRLRRAEEALADVAEPRGRVP